MKGDWDADGDPLVALQNGDPSVFDAFVRSETPTFRGFFRRLGAAADEAEDLVQEVFVRLVRYAPRYRAQDRIEAFCFRTARNVWIDSRRSRGLRRAESADTREELARVSDGAREPIEPLAEKEEAQRALRLLERLPEGQRMVFELGVIAERPYPEIAAELGIPVGTVKSRMFNAVRRLRDLLEEESAAHAPTHPESARPRPTLGRSGAPTDELPDPAANHRPR